MNDEIHGYTLTFLRVIYHVCISTAEQPGYTKKMTIHNMPYNPPAYGIFSFHSFQKEGVKVTSKCALYFMHTISHAYHPTAY
jgi:hypothetical protein